jgi:hypothetical protein
MRKAGGDERDTGDGIPGGSQFRLSNAASGRADRDRRGE